MVDSVVVLDCEQIAHQYKEGDNYIHLAEECSELSKACIKAYRALKHDTPVGYIETQDQVFEEIADVLLSIDVLINTQTDYWQEIKEVYDRKLERWKTRIAEKQVTGKMYTY